MLSTNMTSLPVIEQSVVIAGMCAYALAAILSWLTSVRNYPLMFLHAGWLSFAIAVISRWAFLGQGPFMTLYEVLISNLFTLGLIYAFVSYRHTRLLAVSGVVSLFLFLLAIWAVVENTAAVPLPASFDNYWLWVHVISGKIFLGLCLVAVSIAVTFILQSRLPQLLSLHQRADSELEPILWRYLSMAFVAHSCMLFAGAVWAHDAWGRFWTWDPLETWSLLTWLVMALILHARITFRIPGWTGWLLVNGVFIMAFLTFFGIPFLSIAPHKGII